MNAYLAQIKNDILPILKQAGIKRSGIFGSYVRQENTNDSDIDLLVDFPRNKSLYDFIALKLKLEDTLGKKVDLVDYSTIKSQIKNTVLNQQIRIL